MKVKSEVAQSYPTLSDPMDCSLPGSSIHGIFQARVLEWGAISFFVFLAPFKSSLHIWSLKLYYDMSIVSLKCYATWNSLGLLHVWTCVFISSEKFSVVMLSNLDFSLSSASTSLGTWLDVYEGVSPCLLCLLKSLSYFLVSLGCTSYNVFSSFIY